MLRRKQDNSDQNIPLTATFDCETAKPALFSALHAYIALSLILSPCIVNMLCTPLAVFVAVVVKRDCLLLISTPSDHHVSLGKGWPFATQVKLTERSCSKILLSSRPLVIDGLRARV